MKTLKTGEDLRQRLSGSRAPAHEHRGVYPSSTPEPDRRGGTKDRTVDIKETVHKPSLERFARAGAETLRRFAKTVRDEQRYVCGDADGPTSQKETLDYQACQGTTPKNSSVIQKVHL